MSASAASGGSASSRFESWGLFLMDADTAEPILAFREDFTRLGRSVLEAKAKSLELYGIPDWRIDPIKVGEA